MVDRWRASDRWTVVFGAQVVSAGRDVRTTNATTGAVSNPKRSLLLRQSARGRHRLAERRG